MAPGCATRVRHHGENDAILYAASGRRGVLLTNPGGGDPHELEDEQNHGKDGDRNSGEASRTDVTAATQLDAPNARNMSKKATRLKRDAIAPGDVVFIPPWTEHQIANEGSRSLSGDDGGDGDVVWLVVQNGSAPIFVELVDWGGAEAS